MLECDYTTEFQSRKRQKYGKKIIAERANFFFLEDGSMVYDTAKFDSYVDAMVDAVKNHGEDLDDMISLVFPEKVDHPIVKKKMLNLLNKK